MDQLRVWLSLWRCTWLGFNQHVQFYFSEIGGFGRKMVYENRRKMSDYGVESAQKRETTKNCGKCKHLQWLRFEREKHNPPHPTPPPHENEKIDKANPTILGFKSGYEKESGLTMPQKPGLAVPTPPFGQRLRLSRTSHNTDTLRATLFRSNGDESSVPIWTWRSVPIVIQGSIIDGVFVPPASKPAHHQQNEAHQQDLNQTKVFSLFQVRMVKDLDFAQALPKGRHSLHGWFPVPIQQKWHSIMAYTVIRMSHPMKR